ncbi:hypothetical protein Q4I30_006747 [Leishmania utingensis]|uniref:Uncharacterized protein n=1 Tax=Leishmania utingensis TaxID=653362 RepID=A0AAW3A2V0_9TRYP
MREQRDAAQPPEQRHSTRVGGATEEGDKDGDIVRHSLGASSSTPSPPFPTTEELNERGCEYEGRGLRERTGGKEAFNRSRGSADGTLLLSSSSSRSSRRHSTGAAPTGVVIHAVSDVVVLLIIMELLPQVGLKAGDSMAYVMPASSSGGRVSDPHSCGPQHSPWLRQICSPQHWASLCRVASSALADVCEVRGRHTVRPL